MAKSATISMRIDGQLKAETETIFQQLGMTTTEAIKIFLAAVRNRKGLPFQVQVVSEQAPALEKRKKALDALSGAYPLMTSSSEFSNIKLNDSEQAYIRLLNSVKVGPGDIPSDIQAAREARLEKYR